MAVSACDPGRCHPEHCWVGMRRNVDDLEGGRQWYPAKTCRQGPQRSHVIVDWTAMVM